MKLASRNTVAPEGSWREDHVPTSPIHWMVPHTLGAGLPPSLHSPTRQLSLQTPQWKDGMAIPRVSLPPDTLTPQSCHYKTRNTQQAILLYRYL